MDLVLEPSLEAFADLASEGDLVPVFAELTADYETPLSAFRKIDDGSPSFLLESAEMNEQAGRFSFLGNRPRKVYTVRGQEITVEDRDGGTEVHEIDSDPLAFVEKEMAAFQPVANPALPVFWGGAVGYLSYDMVRHFEPSVDSAPEDDRGLPDMVFFLADTVLIFDHRHRKIQVVATSHLPAHESPEAAWNSARDRINEVIENLQQPLPTPALEAFPVEVEPVSEEELVSNTTKEEFCAMVETAKEYIAAGDVFQAVPSQRFEFPYEGDPIDLYRALRHINPSPYMFCLQFGDGFSLVGSSPEVHVRSIEGRIDIRPIAGTRWRGKTPEEDDALAEELLNDPKECAEHIMLVDLARNDVGRVAKYESVEVTDLMIIERYSHVMHIVSNVTGQLDGKHSAYDVMRATLPAGTVSGSPKVRAMQIIDEMEKNRRGPYAGAVGYFGFDGAHDSCIALRTCVLCGGKAYVQAGCGVVADSDPESEYLETVNKARGMLRAVKRAAGA